MKIIKKYYPFWLGLYVCVLLVNLTREYSSIGILLAFIIGYYRLTDFNELFRK